MATKNIVPRADGEGSLGTSAKKWGAIYADSIVLDDEETLAQKISAQNTRITTAEGNVTTLSGTVETLSGDVTTLYGDIEELSDGKLNITDAESTYLKLSGGTLSGDVSIEKASGKSRFVAQRTDTNSLAVLSADDGGGNLRLKNADDFVEIDTFSLGGTNGYVRLFVGDATIEAQKTFKFLKNGQFVDGNNVNLSTSITNYPLAYYVEGGFLNAIDSLSAVGTGRATVLIYANRLARVDFTLKLRDTYSGGSSYTWGINRDILVNLNSNIPTITPSTNASGNMVVYNANGTINTSLTGYGGCFQKNGQFWTPARVYTEGGDIGGWSSNNFSAGMYIVGTCYGTW